MPLVQLFAYYKQDAQQAVRLFMIIGVCLCAGGAGRSDRS